MWWQLAGSLLAVTGIVWAISRIGFGREPEYLDCEEARDISDHAFGGFSNAPCTLTVDRRSALLQRSDGAIAMVHPHGARSMARLLTPQSVVTVDGSILTLQGPPPVRLDLGDEAGIWADRIGRQAPGHA